MRGPPEVFAREVLPRLLAAPAELILDALPPLQPQTRFLEVGAGGAVVARALVERIAGLGRLVAIDHDSGLALGLPAGPKRGARAVAQLRALPFTDAVFDTAIANLVLGNAHDGPHLAELRRVLRPGGWLLATVLLEGSFDELFDLIFDVFDARLRAVATASKAAFPDDDALGLRFAGAGLAVAQSGIEDRLLCLVDGDALLQDALIAEVLLPAFLGQPVPDEMRRGLVQAARARFPGGMPLQARTAIVAARRPTADDAQAP